MHRLAIFTFVLATLTAGCNESVRSLGTKLNASHSADEEARVFTQLRRPGMQLQAFDAESHVVPMTEHEWWNRTQRIAITIDRETISHVLIEKKNVLILMGE